MLNLGKNLTIAEQVRRINRELNAVADRCAGPVEQTLLTQAALLATEQRALAPVDPESATPGALKESVRVERGQPTTRKAFVLRILAGGRTTLKVGKSGRAYDYARAVVFGTVNSRPFDFFFAPYRARKKEIRAAVRKVVKKSVAETFK